MKNTLLIIMLLASAQAFSQQADTTNRTVSIKLEKFERIRSTGKIMQLVGTAGMFTYFLLNKKYNDRIERGEMQAKPPSGVIPIVSTGFIGVGLAIDISAGMHLKRKK